MPPPTTTTTTTTATVITTPYVKDDDDRAVDAPEHRSCGSYLQQWWNESLWPGMGLFGESYLLFSIGTLTPIWKELYPTCFGGTSGNGQDNDNDDDDDDNDDNENDDNDYTNDDACSPWLLPSLTYGVVLGVIAGMILLGYGSDRIGRRKGSILTASLMVAGSLGLVWVAMQSTSKTWTAEGVFRGTVAALVVFGIGVGGEYPLSAGLASEKATEELARNNQRVALVQEARAKRQRQRQRGEGGGVDPPVPEPVDHHRGRRVQLVFAMQGLGIWFNSLVMLVLFWILQGRAEDNTNTNNNNNNNNNDNDNDNNNDNDNDNNEQYDYLYQTHDLVTIWRITYAIGASVLCFVLITRILYLEESKVWLEAQQNHAQTDDPSAISNVPNSTNRARNADTSPAVPAVDAKTRFRLVHQQYGSRLFGAGTAWLLWDVSFYGNKLFQSTFLEILVGDNPGPVRLTQAALINATVALAGYYGAAALIDATLPATTGESSTRLLGRTRLQTLGFLANGVLFVACGALVASGSSNASATIALYWLSSFVGQLGPNCTTFLIPAEIVPTDQRTYGHGVCAAAGKVGALVAAVVFHKIAPENSDSDSDHRERLFYLSGACSLLAAAVTHGFVPESAGLDLLELDLQWKLLLMLQNEQQGDETTTEPVCEYDGPASYPDHTSLFERYRQRRTEREKLRTTTETNASGGPRHLFDGWFA